MKNTAIETKEVGKISGRDAIFLDLLQQDLGKLSFIGEFNSSLISKNKFDCKFIPYKLIFEDVIYFECCELDFSVCNYESSFDVVENSELLLRFKKHDTNKITENHKHFVLQTYDYVYNILAVDYKLEINPLCKNKNEPFR